MTVPNGTAVTALKATFAASRGATVYVGEDEQTSGTTENDFTNPVTYTVVGHDGTTENDYTVTVTVEEAAQDPEDSGGGGEQDPEDSGGAAG